MDRMGHSSTRAALVYLHASNARQRAIADSLGGLAQGQLQGRNEESGSGLAGRERARNGHERGDANLDGPSDVWPYEG